jgi:cytochrome c peroxidase
LFFDKILSGNRDISCATCHQATLTMTDGNTLAIGTGGTGSGPSRTLGAGRVFVPRNAPTLVNQGLGLFYEFWDGRVNDGFGPGGSTGAPKGVVFPPGLTGIIAKQAMLPVLNRTEMRGKHGDVDVFGNPNELARFTTAENDSVWQGAMRRLLAIQAYLEKFQLVDGLAPQQTLNFAYAANAIAAFEVQTLTRAGSPFDHYLAADDHALTLDQKKGALLFFGKGRCASCHSGALLGGQQFANAAVPQAGPGVAPGAPLDIGEATQFAQDQQQFVRFFFRVPPLRNVELTAPYMHDGVYRTLDEVLRHYTNADSALRAFNAQQLPPALQPYYHGDAATITAVLSTIDFRLSQQNPLTLDATERAQLIEFLKSLTDPSARDLSAIVPASVPSGLPVTP